MVAAIEVKDDNLVLQLALVEKVLSLGGNRSMPLRQVASIDQVQDPWRTVRDVRAMIPSRLFGSRLPGCMYGSIETLAGWDIYAIHGHRAGIRIIFTPDASWARLIATVRNPSETVFLVREAVAEGDS